MLYRNLLFLIFCHSFSLSAQIRGRITDVAGEPLAFVSVLPNEATGRVAISDIEGRFVVDNSTSIQSLLFRYVGFEPLRLDSAYLKKYAGKPLHVVLMQADYALPEAVIRAGENPADVLIRKAIANRDRNNPEKYSSFICNTYNKVNFEAMPKRAVFEKNKAKRDTSQKGVQEQIAHFDQVEKAMKDHYFLFMESVTERSFKAPNQNQEKVLLNRVSGFKDIALVAIANAVQPFSFYGDYLHVLDKDYVNPISPGSPGRYFFHIEDTIFAGPDTVWVISFRPRKGKIFDALEGVLHLNSNGWAIQNVRAHPAKFNGILTMKIEQAYQRTGTDSLWFPEQLNFEIELPRYPDPSTGIRISGRSFIDSVRIAAALRQRDFIPEMPVYLEPGATNSPAGAWEKWRRAAPLNRKESRTYQWLDSLSREGSFNGISKLFNYAMTGKAYLRYGISLDLNRLLHFNQFENTRFGIGLTTAEARPMRLPCRLEFGASVGYGVGDKAFKYGGYALWRMARFSQTQLRVAWRHDLLEPGALYELPKSDVINRSLYARRMDYTDEFSASAGSNLWRGAQIQATFRQQTVKPGYVYLFGAPDSPGIGRFHFTETTLFFRYAADEKSNRFMGEQVNVSNKIPILEIAFTRGWKDVWQGDYNYNRLVLALRQSLFVRRLGRLSWRLEAGQTTPGTPIAKLFTLNQASGDGLTLFMVHNTFQSLPDTLFLADRFVNVYLLQELGPVLYHTKRSAPLLSLLQNMAVGDLKRPELQRVLGFDTARKPLLESGVQIDNLLLFKYFNIAHVGLGGAVFYRWGGLDTGDWKRNFVGRLALKFTFG